MHPHTKLREQYAKERTMLSIDRTILSYIRTSLTTFAMGITFIKFFDDNLLVIGGFILVAFSIILLLFGIRRGLQAHKHIKKYVISQSSE
ncbi:MAG: DUF202 domain-containing protein [Candidatus Roizmanbacteria bacterium]|nr:DUF202 domain-containing protein [Candidatus Roizmanbacteria bacterium]